MKFIAFVSLCIFSCFSSSIHAQTGSVSGKVTTDGKPAELATVKLSASASGAVTDSTGFFTIRNVPKGKYTITISRVGYQPHTRQVIVNENQSATLQIELIPTLDNLDEVVVTGTLKEVKRIESPVPVEVYTPTFFRKNPTPNIFDALQNVNGIRPQLNCNVCNTGDIHINGLEGPYTMVLIDGMPIVSSLSTVYGLSGIPNSLVERIEIVKGPASSLYGSEAVGGLINIITKKPVNAPLFSADVYATSWQEYNADLGVKMRAGKKAMGLTGINYYKYGNIKDNNHDNFTDVTLQDRISIFQKWSFDRKDARLFSLAARYFYEDRWGGETNWTKEFRGGDSIYGENIYTKRWEFIGNYQLPVKEKLMLSFSYNDHDQDSRYGNTSYIAQQRIAFSQLTWDKKAGGHDLLLGAALRYTFYDDNTPGTAASDPTKPGNKPQKTWLPGIFLQDEISLGISHKLLFGFRYDYNSIHGSIYTPRMAYKWSINDRNIIRLNAGTGYRVVNLFTEDHAALTGARQIEIKENLSPEKTYNVNLNYLKKIYTGNGNFIGLDMTAWYTYFNNRIIGDFITDPNKIIYDNLDGYAVSKGISANLDFSFHSGLKILAGTTLLDVATIEQGVKQRQLLAERFTGTWAVSYKIKKLNLGIDYTGNIYGPMKLPILGKFDPRPVKSPIWSIQNIQLVYSGIKKFEIYGGVKNLLNWTPNKGTPFIIARSHDPFDKRLDYNGDGNIDIDANGQALRTPENPYGLTFDTNYVYAPNQGIRGFLGVRVTIQ
jgi:outer membrane receptor for ferrienterochelin and colicins